MELGLITQYTQVNDAADIKLTGTSWYPKNSGGGNYGVITIREALQRSLNTVSAQILDKLTPRASYEFLKDKLGVTSLAESDCDYAPLALGQLTNGITVREMTQAYSAFVNDGVFTYGRTYSYVKDSSGEIVLENPARTIVAFKANTAWNMADMLCNAVNSGTGSEARLTGMSVGGKTGTTTNNCDRWFVGFTPYYVAAVWTGYDMPEYMNFSGNPAAQIWKLVMEPIHKDLATKSFPTPNVGYADRHLRQTSPARRRTPAATRNKRSCSAPSAGSCFPAPKRQCWACGVDKMIEMCYNSKTVVSEVYLIGSKNE